MARSSNRISRRGFAKKAATGLVGTAVTRSLLSSSAHTATTLAKSLSAEHLAAVNRQRRIIVTDDGTCWGTAFGQYATPTIDHIGPENLKEVIGFALCMIDEEPNQIDSLWWDWGMPEAAWPSNIMPRSPALKKWWDAGIDPFEVLLKEAKKRGREVFFSYRLNGGIPSLMKSEHPEWLMQPFPDVPHDYMNFAFQGVRDHKLSILREVAESYDFDGIDIDLTRIPMLFPPGEQWEKRHFLTDFMRKLRSMLLEIEQERGRAFLLAVHLSENLMGCHFDGMDVETWARESLVDILVPGSRSSDVDLAAFRRITEGTGIKLYPSYDVHHASDGYHHPPIEVLRGVYANWWRQRADGAHTFNLCHPSPKAAAKADLVETFVKMGATLPIWEERWEVQRQALREIGSPETLQNKSKTFYVQRRGGGHGRLVVPDPENWSTPRHYGWSNMFAPLPATLANDGKVDTLLTCSVADDVNSEADRIDEITLRIALSDRAAQGLPESDRLPQVIVANAAHIESPDGTYRNFPPAKGIEKLIEVRLNNILLGPARIGGGWLVNTGKGPVKDGEGWLVFSVKACQLALGDNLVGVRVRERQANARDQIIIERLELHMRYL